MQIAGDLVAIKRKVLKPSDIGAHGRGTHVGMAETGLNPVLLGVPESHDLRKSYAVDLLKIRFHLARLGHDNLLKYAGTLVNKGNREGNRGSGK